MPLGVVSNAVGYSKHSNAAVTGSSVLGISCVTAASTVKRLTPHRTLLGGVGCAIMLAASYKGRELERTQVEMLETIEAQAKNESQCCSSSS